MKKPDCQKCLEDNRADFISSPFGKFGKCNTCDRIKKYNTYLSNKRLFTEGEAIKSIDELLKQEWVLINGRGRHIKVILNMQFATVIRWLENGYLKEAVRKDKLLIINDL